jgi:hypothetical protein
LSAAGGETGQGDADQQQMEGCTHESGYRTQQFDADGCGFYLWTCEACGWSEVDTMP